MRWIGRLTKPKTADATAPQAESRHDAGARSSLDDACATVRASLAEHVVAVSDGKLAHDAIDPNAPLFDYGYIDSLSSVSLIEMIRERYDVEVSEIDLVARLNTLHALARFIAGAGGRAS